MQRSLDGGATWQDVSIVPDIRIGSNFAAMKSQSSTYAPRAYPVPIIKAISASGSEIWAGGAGGVLFHSMDAGSHWAQVAPSSGDSALTDDIVGITFGQLHGTLTTSAGESWVTKNGGQSWKKQ